MARPAASLSPLRGAVGLIVLFGLILSALIWRYAAKKENERIHAEFLRRAEVQASFAREKLLLYEEMIYSLRSAFLGQTNVNRKEFADVTRELLSRHVGTQALEWVQIVNDADRSAVEGKASRELGVPFVFKHRNADGTFVTSPPQQEYFPILYIEPLAGNEVALGYDVGGAATGPTLRAARTDRTLKVSHAFRLAQSVSEDDEPGVALILPVFKDAAGSSPVLGFVQGVFRVQTMLSQAHRFRRDEALQAYYLDYETPSATPTLLYANLAGREPLREHEQVRLPDQENPEAFRGVIELGDRTWWLVIEMNPAWARQQQGTQPVLIFAAGIAMTALLALFINSILLRTEGIAREVALRTAQLRESEARLQAVLDHSPALIFVKDLAGRYVLFNQKLEKLCQRPAAAIKGHTDHELFPAANADSYVANDQRALTEGKPVEFEETVEHDGKSSTWMVQKFPLLDSAGKAYALCGISTEITERKNAELETRESRRQLGNLISQLPGAAFRCAFDEKLTALFASEGMLPLTGFPADDFVSGRIHIASLTRTEDRPAVRNAVATAIKERQSFELEYRIIHRDSQEKWVLVRGRPIYDEVGALRFIEGLAIDVTALKHAEREKIAFERNLLETQKLESLGVLAGGIAHDFNNLLTAILGNASLLRYSLLRTDSSQAHLEQIENAARRAADLCAQMLAYAGKGKLSNGRIDLTHLVKDTTSLLEVSIRKNCRLILQLAENLPAILGDATQLRQIVMNLVINASDAIGERADGQITVTTFVRKADATLLRSALHQPKLEPGNYIGLEVKDNGCGMTAETIARIFEPFFTTKFSGRGLGLSAVMGIVQSHQGALFVESQPNQGSTFRLLLPAVAGTAPEGAKPNSGTAPIALNCTILVADDEESVRLLVDKALSRHGAKVIPAKDGIHALDLYQQRRDEIDLILLDLTMPGMSGEEVLIRLRELKATQKIIIMSGYGEQETMKRCAELGVVAFVSKPFEIETVVTKLRSLV